MASPSSNRPPPSSQTPTSTSMATHPASRGRNEQNSGTNTTIMTSHNNGRVAPMTGFNDRAVASGNTQQPSATHRIQDRTTSGQNRNNQGTSTIINSNNKKNQTIATTTDSNDEGTNNDCNDANKTHEQMDESNDHGTNQNEDDALRPTDDQDNYPIPRITPHTNCHWTIFEIPVDPKEGDSAKKATIPCLSDIITLAIELDQSFSLLNQFTTPEQIRQTTPLELLNDATTRESPITVTRVQQFARNCTFKEPNHFNQHQSTPKKLLHFEAHIATTIALNDMIAHLHQHFQPYCGRVLLHPINHCRPTKIGVLLKSTAKTNRTELQEIISRESAPVSLETGNIGLHFNLNTRMAKVTRKEILKDNNVIIISTSPDDEDTVIHYLRTTFPQEPDPATPADAYPTMRKMIFHPENTTSDIDQLVQIALEQHEFAEEEASWETHDILPLTSPVKLQDGSIISVQKALSILTIPYPTGARPLINNDTPVIHGAAQGINDKDKVFLYYQKKPSNMNQMKVLMTNLGRAFEIHFGNHNISRQILRPHARHCKPKTTLLGIYYQWHLAKFAPREPPQQAEQNTASSTQPAITGDEPPSDPAHDDTHVDGPKRPNGKRRKIGTPTKPKASPKSNTNNQTARPRKLFFMQQFEQSSRDDQNQPRTASLPGAQSQAIVAVSPRQLAPTTSAWNTTVQRQNHQGGEFPTPAEDRLMSILDRALDRQSANFHSTMNTFANSIRVENQATRRKIEDLEDKHHATYNKLDDLEHRLRRIELSRHNTKTTAHSGRDTNHHAQHNDGFFDEDMEFDDNTPTTLDDGIE